MRARFVEIDWPDYGPVPEVPPRAEARLYVERLEQFADAFSRAGFTHGVVYGDREHFANVAWLTGFDPRFEEALLVVRGGVKPLLLAGNESIEQVERAAGNLGAGGAVGVAADVNGQVGRLRLVGDGNRQLG